MQREDWRRGIERAQQAMSTMPPAKGRLSDDAGRNGECEAIERASYATEPDSREYHNTLSTLWDT